MTIGARGSPCFVPHGGATAKNDIVFDLSAAIEAREACSGSVAEKSGTFHYQPAKILDQKHVVDTTGAGDAWIGAWICGIVSAIPILERLKIANSVATECVTHVGARPPISPVAPI